MILADKIIRLRKKNGWSQEELAEKVGVSRQAVSKWEGAQSIPDLEKILALGKLFGVTTDYLLKDELEDEEFTDDGERTATRRITLAQANAFLDWRREASVHIAAGTLLCVLAVIPLLILSAASEVPAYHLSGDFACGLGVIALLVIVAIAVGIFVLCGFRNAPFDFIDREPFETEYGVAGMVKERQQAYRYEYAKQNVIGTCLCVLSPVPLFVGIIRTQSEFFTVLMLCATLLLAGVGAAIFVVAGVRWSSMQKLLKEGEYSPQEKRKSRVKGTIAAIYWLAATAVYLAWSFLGRSDWLSGRGGSDFAWKASWIVWPVAGVLFAAVMCLCNLWLDRSEQR